MAKFLSKDGKFYMRNGKLLRPTNILEVPIVTTNLTYNGKSQSPTIYGYNENTMTMGGVMSGTNVGTYHITFTPKSGYEWSDGTSETKTISWSITKAAGSLSLSASSMTIDTNSTYGYITVYRTGDGAISASSNNTGVATVSVSGTTITVTKVGQGSATITVSVAEGTNHTAPASKTCTVTCKTGTPVGSLAVGSSVYINVDGVRKEFLVVNQGNPDTSIYDSSCDGTWLLMKDCYENRQWHSSGSNSYKASTIHSYLNSTFLNLFDSNIKDAIKQVKIPYVNGTSSSAVASGANGLSAKIFLLSGREVGLNNQIRNLPNDGVKLDYFNANAGGSDSKRIAYLNGSACYWWLRSPHTRYDDEVWGIGERGQGVGIYILTGAGVGKSGVRPALILPSDETVDTNMNVIASGT